MMSDRLQVCRGSRGRSPARGHQDFMNAKTLLRGAALIIAALLLYLLFWPVPISPVAWTPPAAPPLAGQFERNTRLAGVQRLDTGGGFAPEDVALDAQGRIYGGLEDGRIVRLQA